MFVALPTQSLGQSKNQTAGEKFKHIEVLRYMPENQMGKVMNIMSASLGVNCSYCHDGNDFSKEDVGEKTVAREMIAMTLKLNREHFKGRTEVTCNTCHRGKAVPDSTLALSAAHFSKPTQTRDNSADHSTHEQVLADYVVALGGAERLSQIQSRHVTGKRVEPSGQTEPEELWQTKNGSSKMSTAYGKTVVSEGFDGQKVWKKSNEYSITLKPDEAEQIAREVDVAFGSNLANSLSSLRYDKTEEIDGSLYHVLSAVTPSGLNERLYFDAKSHLLVRRIATVPTVLGDFDYQVDYLNYQSFENVQQPTLYRFAVPNIQWSREVTDIRFNFESRPGFFAP